MAENNLTDFEAQELLRQYSSDLRKLEFQLQQTKLAIHNLKGKSTPTEKVSTLKKMNNEVDIINALFEKDDFTESKDVVAKKSTSKIAKVREAKPKVEKATTNKKVPGFKGRKSLNPQWDTVVSDNMGTKENPKTSNELLQDLINARDKKYILDEGNTKLIQRLNASLTKLYKQNKIGKQKIEGKKAYVYFNK
ncbi:MAG: hypothetical protein NWR65_15685 [Saprospiraceae bacterium]|nr:hypothetical protein [Saprospiraceae bacterium]